MTGLLLACVAVALGGLAFIAHKARRIHRLLHDVHVQLDRRSADVIRQVEALQALYRDLELVKSLPPTRGWAASPDFLAVLMRHALSAKPDMVVECGSGVSTVVLARALQINGRGHLYSLEHLAEHAARTRDLLERHGVASFATVLDAPLRTQGIGSRQWPWYSPEGLPEARIDMLVIDGPPWTAGALARYPAGPFLFPRLASSATVFLDDAARPDERAVLDRWQSEFPDLRQEKLECEKGCASLRKAG
jgi:predicted O-methyltransferase YrrM